MQKDAVAVFIEVLKHEHLRSAAAVALSGIGPEDEAAVPTLMDAL